MTDPAMASAKQRIIDILNSLTEDERKLFTAVVQIERENLHLERPHVKADLLGKVREYVK
jgi:hypothetical protein